MSWRELVNGFYKERPLQSGIMCRPEFFPAASITHIADTESALQATLPDSLRSLLQESNGLMEMMAIDGGHWFESMWLLWNIDEILKQNCYYRGNEDQGIYERDFGALVFFAGAGTDGILFAFPVDHGTCANRIVVWHPIRDEVGELAPSLEAFLRGWLTGTITV